MGGSRWSDDSYTARSTDRAVRGVSAFAYTDDLRKQSVDSWKCHPQLDPKGVKVRESRDSEAHPTSRAISVLFDVTGSMQVVPQILQKKLPPLMNLLIKKGYVEHPQILFGAIGDATCDKVPIQIGQFESGIEMDDDLSRIMLEGGGGGQKTESYELSAYFMARHTAMDCFEKRKEKGFLFIVGDEMCYPMVSKSEVRNLIGDSLEKNISTKDIFEELKKTFEVFYMMPAGTQHSGDSQVWQSWQKLVGQNAIRLDSPESVCETLALTIGMYEGKTNLDKGEEDLVSAGIDKSTAKEARKALSGFSGRRLVL